MRRICRLSGSVRDRRRRAIRASRRRKRAFVLGGGGALGALQVGALRALLESNVRPDLLVGTSAGAINAAHLAVHGFTPQGLARLEDAWRDAAAADLMSFHALWLTVRALFKRPSSRVEHRLREFVLEHGLDPELRFGQIAGPRLILVATDLKGAKAILYGEDPEHLVLEGLLASTALPPWIPPLAEHGHLLMDGGVVSNLPIEPALAQGATEIVALDLSDPWPLEPEVNGFGPFLGRLLTTVARRQIDLEMALAKARGVPVHRLVLCSEQPAPIWDFGHTEASFAQGYDTAQRAIARWSR